MNKKVIYLIFLTIFVIILISFIIVFIKKGSNNVQVEDGTVKERKIPGYKDIIKSKDIKTFYYNNSKYILECKKENNNINIKAEGNYSNERDGKYFKLDYNTKNINFLNEIQNIIDKYNISKKNGYVHAENVEYYREINSEKVIVADVSQFNFKKNFKDKKDFQIFLLKNKISYVYIRSGGRGYGKEGKMYYDTNYKDYIEACEYLKIP